jgi:DNA-binding LytR/AlgR family response regulator
MPKTCIIIEDQPPAQRILQKYIADTESLNLKGTFPDAIKAMAFLNTEKIDLIFLDIHLPKISGIDFLKAVPNHPSVILTTAFSDYALESYEYNVVDYLLKPFSFQRFIQAVSKLSSIQTTSNPKLTTQNSKELNETIFIKSGYEHIKIIVSDIIFIKSDTDYTEIVTTQKKYLSTNSLKYWLDKLTNKHFYRIHKSYIINTQHLIKISSNLVYLPNITVPIGRAYKEIFISTYLK